MHSVPLDIGVVLSCIFMLTSFTYTIPLFETTSYNVEVYFCICVVGLLASSVGRHHNSGGILGRGMLELN